MRITTQFIWSILHEFLNKTWEPNWWFSLKKEIKRGRKEGREEDKKKSPKLVANVVASCCSSRRCDGR